MDMFTTGTILKAKGTLVLYPSKHISESPDYVNPIFIETGFFEVVSDPVFEKQLRHRHNLTVWDLKNKVYFRGCDVSWFKLCQ